MFGKSIVAAAAFLVAAAPAWAQRLDITCESLTGRALTVYSDGSPPEGDNGWGDDNADWGIRLKVDIDSWEVELYGRVADDPEWASFYGSDTLVEVGAIEGDPAEIVAVRGLTDAGSTDVFTFVGVQNSRATLVFSRSSLIGSASISSVMTATCRVRPWRN